MLPPILRTIKENLANKGYAQRTTREDALFAELERLDQLIEEDAPLRKSILSEARIVSGPSAVCPCCGK